jgi:hypothetical protein
LERLRDERVCRHEVGVLPRKRARDDELGVFTARIGNTEVADLARPFPACDPEPSLIPRKTPEHRGSSENPGRRADANHRFTSADTKERFGRGHARGCRCG